MFCARTAAKICFNLPISRDSSRRLRQDICCGILMEICISDAALIGGSPGQPGTAGKREAEQASGQHRFSHGFECLVPWWIKRNPAQTTNHSFVTSSLRASQAYICHTDDRLFVSLTDGPRLFTIRSTWPRSLPNSRRNHWNRYNKQKIVNSRTLWTVFKLRLFSHLFTRPMYQKNLKVVFSDGFNTQFDTSWKVSDLKGFR